MVYPRRNVVTRFVVEQTSTRFPFEVYRGARDGLARKMKRRPGNIFESRGGEQVWLAGILGIQ